MVTFNAIDVETANADRASICQIGIVQVCDGKLTDRWQTLIDPEDWFDEFNVAIHGIEERDVTGSPTFAEIESTLRQRLNDCVVVSHSSFDRVAIERALARYHLEPLNLQWLDSAMIVRRTWPDQFGKRGYGLKNVADAFNIEFVHHDALEDARAVAEIVVMACEQAGFDIQEWIRRVKRPIFARKKSGTKRGKSISRTGNPDGIMFGETVAFTGALSIARHEAADLAADLGCNVVTSVSKKVSMLIIGTQNRSLFNGYDKSSKHRKAESLISEGTTIQILSESDFLELVNLSPPTVSE